MCTLYLIKVHKEKRAASFILDAKSSIRFSNAILPMLSNFQCINCQSISNYIYNGLVLGRVNGVRYKLVFCLMKKKYKCKCDIFNNYMYTYVALYSSSTSSMTVIHKICFKFLFFFIFSLLQFSSDENKMEVGPMTIVHVPRKFMYNCIFIHRVQINRVEQNLKKLKF